MGLFASRKDTVHEVKPQDDQQLVIPAGWTPVIQEQIQSLLQLTGNTEEEFLTLGSQFHAFHDQAADIVGSAQEMLGRVSGQNVHATSADLHQLLGRMDTFLASTERETVRIVDAFSHILDLFSATDEPLNNFKKINKILRMLGTATKIESARMGTKAVGFETLANDVAAMSVRVVEKATLVLRQKEELTVTIGSALRQMRGAETAQSEQVRLVLERLRQDIALLDGVNDKCTAAVDLIGGMTRELADGISQVVMSMQFHDITRQQIEHVHEALAELLQHFAGCGTGDAALRPIIQEAGDICELQAAQLRHAAEELSGAVGTITGNLRHVASETAGLSARIGELMGVADEAGSSFLLEMESALLFVNRTLAESARVNQELTGVMEGVTEKVRNIAVFVKEIAYIGGEIELIALNSQVKSARAGEEGAALGVLAEAIQRLSADTETLTATTSTILLEITSSTEELCAGVDADAASINQDVNAMVDEVGQIMTSLKEVNQALGQGSVAMHGVVDDLGQAINTAVGSITVHETICQVAGRVATTLTHIAGEAQALVPSLVGGTGGERLKRLAERYTMQSERHVHEKIAGLGTSKPAVAVTLTKVTADDSGFGDNVELF